NSSTIDVCDNHSEILFDSNNDDLSSDDESFEDIEYILFDSNNDDLSSDDESFKDIEYVDASVPNPAIVSVKEENVVHREEEEVDLEDISQVQDVVLREKLFSITCLISNIESLNEKSTPDRALNSFESDNSLLDNFSPEFETFCDHSEETRSEDMQRKKNDVKARTTLLLSLPIEHQLRFSKYKTAKELWAAILKTFGVWRNRNDLDTMSLDDLYNHLKVYEAKVQKKSNSNSQNMAFISSSKNNSGNEDGIIACSKGSQIKFEDINQIDEDDMEEMDIKWSMALLSMRADKFWKRTGKKISIQGSDVAEFDELKVECFNCHKMGHFARDCRAPKSQERGRKENYRQASKAEEKTPKALMAIDEVGWRSDKVKEGVGYNDVPPHAADLYLSPKKYLSWTGLPEFVDDTVTDYSRPSSTVASTSAEDQNKDSSTSKDVASPNTPKPFVKFVKSKDSQSESKTDKKEKPKKPQVKYAEQYRHSNNKPNVKGNQRNLNNLKSYQLGPKFVLNKKACFNYGDFSHLANNCRKRVQRDTTRSQKHAYESPSHRSGGHKPHGVPMRTPHRSDRHRPHGASMRPSQKPAGYRPHGPSMNPMRPNMNSARPNRLFFIQAHSYENKHFLKSSAVKTQYRAP
nr:hypothetical protein [Tanacetum cinerariifolium]